jgi:two-component system, response regulator PdtaR
VLRGAGYDVLGPATSVGVALELLPREQPKAAVLDVNLGGERVTPVAEVLRAMSIPYVLASGYGATELNEERVLREAVNLAARPSISANRPPLSDCWRRLVKWSDEATSPL